MATSTDLRRRLGETEYALIDPRFAHDSRFRTVYSHPEFRDRFDANQLCRVSCGPTELAEMLEDLDREFAQAKLNFRKVSGYDPDVWAHLAPALRQQGWEVFRSTLMLHAARSTRSANPDVVVRSVDPYSEDLEIFYREDGVLDRGFELARCQFERLGGEYIVGFMDSKPAGCTGWYVSDGIARFRHVWTAPWARGRGCATSLILHVQTHPVVGSTDGLVILVNDDGPKSLYGDLGFREAAHFWEAKTPKSVAP